jgi:peroxiredoxin Q/BCP
MGFRDRAPEFEQANVAIVGVSFDQPKANKGFAGKNGFRFPLLSDVDHAVADAYGAWGERSMYGRKYMGILRSAFLIDENGKIAEAWYKVSPQDTATNLLKAIA